MSIGTLATAGVAICQVNDPLPDDAHFLDNDDEKPKLRLSDDPIYSEPEQSVRLVLKNNIVMRNLRKKDRAIDSIGEDIWTTLDDTDHQILVFMSERREVTRLALQTQLKRSNGFVTRRLAKLINMEIVRANGDTHDPKRTYSIIYKK